MILHPFMRSVCFLWEKAKLEKSKVFIYCQVSSCELRNLLDYQENTLRNLICSFDINVVAVVRKVSTGKKTYIG